jgi:hypothetical protein
MRECLRGDRRCQRECGTATIIDVDDWHTVIDVDDHGLRSTSLVELQHTSVPARPRPRAPRARRARAERDVRHPPERSR